MLIIEFHKQNVAVSFAMPTVKNMILLLSHFQFLTYCSICNIGFRKKFNTLLNSRWTTGVENITGSAGCGL